MDKTKAILVSVLIAVTTCVAFAGNPVPHNLLEVHPKYFCEVNLGYGTTSHANGVDTYSGRVIVGTLQGVNLNQFFDTGVGLDIMPFTHYYSGQGVRCGMTLYGDVRVMYPIKHSLVPYIDFGVGGFIGLSNLSSGFYCQFGPGIKYKVWGFCCGLNAIGTGSGCASFFMKLSYKF